MVELDVLQLPFILFPSTLYDLIEAIDDRAGPGEEGVIVEALSDLMRSGTIKSVNGHGNPRRI